MISTFHALMDSDKNPLRHLPKAQRYQLSYTLSAMWTLIFCTSFGAWQWYGSLTVFHILMISGTLVTSSTFKFAQKSVSTQQTLTYRDFPARDGTTRYDDVWGK